MICTFRDSCSTLSTTTHLNNTTALSRSITGNPNKLFVNNSNALSVTTSVGGNPNKLFINDSSTT